MVLNDVHVDWLLKELPRRASKVLGPWPLGLSELYFLHVKNKKLDYSLQEGTFFQMKLYQDSYIDECSPALIEGGYRCGLICPPPHPFLALQAL